MFILWKIRAKKKNVEPWSDLIYLVSGLVCLSTKDEWEIIKRRLMCKYS